MTALSADRTTIEHAGPDYSADVYQSTTIYGGSIVCLNSSGYLVPGSTATGLVAVGRSNEQVDNSSGSSGDLACSFRMGVFSFGNSSSTDEITIAEIGDICYIVDDQTVAKTNGSGTRSPAGKIMGIDEFGGVMVQIGVYASVDGDLVASNNLSDVAAAATARANIGANVVEVFLGRVILNAATTLAVPVNIAGDITAIRSCIEGALTGGDPTITCSIGATPITGGVLTIANSGSALGDVDLASPSAANTVAAGDYIKAVVAANSQSNAVYASVTALIET